MERAKRSFGEDEVPIRDGFFLFPNHEKRNPRLIGSRCKGCGDVVFPKRALCTVCASEELMEETYIGETGTLYTYTVVRVGYPNFETPYILGLVELDDGRDLRVLAQLEDCRPDRVKIGMRLELTIGEIKKDPATGKKVIGYKYRPLRKRK